MKKQSQVKIFLLLLVSFLFTKTYSQEYAYKFGTISKAELEATTYPKAPNAKAVIISDYAYRTIVVGRYLPWTRVDMPRIPNRGYAQDRVYGMFPYVVETTHQQKIKIFNEKGLEKATLKLPFYNKKAPLKEEIIENVEALLHHLNNDKIETTKLDESKIKTKNISDSISEIVVSFPNAQIGDVVEFRYKRTSPLYVGMKNWNFQTDIPVMSALLEVFLYDAFQYNMDVKGIYPIKAQSVVEKPKLNDLQQKVFNGRDAIRTVFLTGNLPAWNEKPKFIWHDEDYISGVDFELYSTRFRGYVPYSATWKEIEARIEDEMKFNKYIYGKNYFKKEVKKLIKGKKTQKEKLEAIYGLIKKKIKWNGQYALLGDVKQAVKKGEGNNAEINSVLIRALKTADIYVYPVLIAPRNLGRFPNNKATFDKIKTFIVCASLPDGMSYYMDGSAYFGGVNAIPTNLMPCQARTLVRSYDLLEGQSNATVNICDISNYNLTQNIEITPKNSTQIIGKTESIYKNLSASIYKKRLSRAGKKEELIVEKERAKEMKITNYNVQGNTILSNEIKESYDFEKEIQSSADSTISFNPFLVADRMQDYSISQERILPVEFDALRKRNVSVTVNIPAGYKVVQLPKSVQNQIVDNSILFSYEVKNKENKINVALHFEINRIKVQSKDLNEFREMVKMINSAINQTITLKKEEKQ